MTIRTYLLLLIGLAGALGVSLSSIQRYTSQRQASSQRSLLASEEVYSKVMLCDQNIQTLATVCDLVFYSNQQVGQGPVTLIRFIEDQLKELQPSIQGDPTFVQDNQRLAGKIQAIDEGLLALDGLIREVEKKGGVFKDMAFSEAYLEKDFQNAIRPIVQLLKNFSETAQSSFQTLSQSEDAHRDAAQKNRLVNLIRNQSDTLNQLINTVCQLGQPDNSPLQLEYEALMESISLSMRGLVDLSETSLERNRFQSEQTGIKNKSLLWGASFLFVLCLIGGFWWVKRGISSPLLQLSVAAEKAVHSHEPYKGYDAGAREIQNLNRSLMHLTHSLEDLVETRTHQLAKTEAEMRKLSHVASRISDAVIITSADGQVEWVNDGFIRQSGYQLKDIYGKRPGSLLQGPKSDPTTVAFMHAQLEAGKGFRVQLINYTKQKRQYWIQLEVQPVYDTEHRLSNYIGVARDITRDKQELRDQRLETIGNVASGLAHDLNNILAPITLSIETLKEMYPDSDEMVDTIEQCSKRAAQMVQQLLNYVKGHAGTVAVFQLTDVMNETVELLRFTLPKKVSIDFSFDLPDTSIHGDSTQIQQMLINLAVNARDAMPEGGRIQLRVERVALAEAQFSSMVLISDKAKPGMFAVIRLADSGTGIEPDKLERIFEPFYTTKAPEEGTGLGLAAVAGIMKGHRGMIQVESKVGHGTTFSLFLPIYQLEAENTPRTQLKHSVS